MLILVTTVELNVKLLPDFRWKGLLHFKVHFNCKLLKPHSEYLVRNQVRTAYKQDFMVVGVKCALYKVWSVCSELHSEEASGHHF